MSKKVLNREEAQALIAEMVDRRVFERRLRKQYLTLAESRSDLESKQIIAIFEEYGGLNVDDPMSIDEGMWEKAKHMLSKIRVGGTSGSTAEEGELQDLADKAATKEFKELFAQIKQAPGFGDYPNNEKQEEFEGITAGLVMLRQALDSGHKAGLIQTDTANELIDKVKSYLGKLNKDLSYSYRYLKEDGEEEIDATITSLDEEIDAMLSERIFTNFNKITKMLDQLQGGKDLSPRQWKKLNKVYKSLDKEYVKKDIADVGNAKGWTPKEDALHSRMQDMFGLGDKPPTPKPAGGGGGGGGASPRPDRAPTPDPDAGLDPSEPDRFGNFSDPGPEPDLGQSMPLDVMPMQKTGLGDIGGMQDIGKIYKKAGSVGTLMNWLGPGFMKSLAGFALPVAGIGAVAGLVGKRLAGHSREGGLKQAAKMMTPLDASEFNSEPQKVMPQGGPGGEEGEGAEGAGKGDIYVQRNPEDGKGLQSQFASAGIKGKDMSGLMRGLRKDLTAAGFNVLEEAKRETVELTNTLAALEQMEDPAQKEVVKKALVAMLKQNKIRVDPKSSLLLRPAGAEGGEDPQTSLGTGEGEGGDGEFKTAADKWVAAGKPEITKVHGRNAVTNDSDHYEKANENILEPNALEYGKAQLAWLQQNKPNDPVISIITKAIEATEAGGAGGTEGGEEAAATPGGKPPGVEDMLAVDDEGAAERHRTGAAAAGGEDAAVGGEEDDPDALARAKERGAAARGRVRGRSGMEESANKNADDKMVNERFDKWKKLAGIIKG